MNRVAAFTLIELMVVLVIVALISSLALAVPGTSHQDRVRAAAQALASTMDEARYASMRSNTVHAVTINLENAGDGTVMKNFAEQDAPDFPGRHWYAIVGPSVTSRDVPPYCTEDSSNFSYFTVDSYTEELRSSMIGGPRYLQRGVRFLALSVTEDAGLPASAGASSDHRPWHGWYSQTEQRAYTWGGFNPEMDDPSKDIFTGLQYRGLYEGVPPYDATLDTRVHPAEVWGMVSEDVHARRPTDVGKSISGNLKNFASTSSYQGPDTSILPGRTRALVNGDWGDYMLSFESDGTCYYTGGLLRSAHFRWNRDHQSMQHHLTEEHGYVITLSRDIDPQDHIGDRNIYDWSDLDPLSGQPHYDRLQSAADLLHTITPYVQVFVPHRRGMTQIRGMEHPRCHVNVEDLLP